MHDFSCDPDVNFPSSIFSHTIYVLDVASQTFDARSMDDGGTGLTEDQIAAIASINTLYDEHQGMLVVAGGYGVDASGDYVTFDSLRVMDVQGVAGWVEGDGSLLADHVRFHGSPPNAPGDLVDGFFTICGGIMLRSGGEFWLCLGQDFQGEYTDGDCPPPYTQVYTRSIRRFRINVHEPDASPEYIGATTRSTRMGPSARPERSSGACSRRWNGRSRPRRGVHRLSRRVPGDLDGSHRHRK